MKDSIFLSGFALIFFIIIGCTDNSHEKSGPVLSPESTQIQSHSNTYRQDYFYDSLSTVTGILKVESYFGPPGHGESPNSDSREDAFILVLDNSINVIQNSKSDSTESFDVTVLNSYKIQLVAGNNYLDTLINKKIKVTGTFYGAHSGHHHTSVLLAVQKAERD